MNRRTVWHRALRQAQGERDQDSSVTYATVNQCPTSRPKPTASTKYVIEAEQMFDRIPAALPDETPSKFASAFFDFDQTAAPRACSGETKHAKDIRRRLLPRHQNVVIAQYELK